MALTDSPRNRRLLANAVGVVLAGNVVALFLVGDGGSDAGGPLDGPAPAGAAEESTQLPEPETITLITNADGSKVVVDPSTPEGRQQIERARESGGTVATVSAPSTTTTTAKKTTTTTAKPRTATNGGDAGNGVPVTVPNLGSTVTTIVDIGNDLIEDVGDTVNDGVDQVTDLTPIPEDDAVVDPIVDSVVTTVVTTVQGVTNTVNETVGSTTPTTTGLLNGLVAEVDDTTTGTVGGLLGP